MKKCFQLLGLLLALLFLSSKSFSQNNLAAGDLAIASYQSDFDPTNTFTVGVAEFEDRFSLIITKPGGIAAGTVIFFTTRGWNGPANTWHDEDFTPFTFGLGRRAVVQWTVPAGGIGQGTEVFFINTFHDELPAGSEYYSWGAYSDYNGTTALGVMANVTPIVPGANTTDGMSFAFSGDKLLVYQTGPTGGPNAGPNNSTIRFITALLANINGTTVVPGTTSYANWDAVPGAMASNESSVPPGLVNGQTCFLMSPSILPAVSNGTTEPDNGKFSACALSAAGVCTALQMSALIYATNPAGPEPTTPNWTYSNNVFPVGTSSSLCSYNILSANTIALTSGAGTNIQTKCINTPITNITYSTTGATGATFSGLPAGVTGAWAGNVVTISGSPTTTTGSPFNYTVTLTGGCGTITATGTITVTPNNTIALTSSAGTNAQTVCINSSITNITYSTTGATGATFSGLPAGVSGSWASNVVTITGSPSTTVGSPFSYTVTLTGGCGTITANGTITVNPLNTITLTSAPGTNSQTVSVNSPITTITYSTAGATGASFSGLPAGVSGSWAGNVVTISGSPSTIVGSPFSYTVTLTGGCGTVTAGGTINVIACSIILTSAVGTDAQIICNGSAINTITYSTNIATGASFSGLPAGVSGSWAGNAVTINGTPSGPGTYNFTVTLTGGGCSNVASGIITVNAIPSSLVISSVGSTSLCTSGTVTLTAAAQSATDLSFSSANTGTYGINQWQSFIPNITGALNAIQIQTNGCPGGNVTLNIYSGVGTGGTLLSTQTGPISGCNTFFAFNITALNLTAGNNYTFQLVTATNLSLIGTYSGYGSYFSDAYGLNPSWRLSFITSMTPALGSVQWYENAVLIPGATMTSYNPVAVGNYTAANFNGSCYSIPSNTITVTNALPVAPVITAGGPTTFCIPSTVTLTAATAPVTDLSFSTSSNGTLGTNQWQSFIPTVDGMTGTIEIQLSGSTNNTYTFNIYSGTGTFGSLISTQSVLINGNGFYPINITPVHLTPGNTYTFQLLGVSSLGLTANNGSYGTYFSDNYGFPSWRLNFKTIVTPFLTNVQWYNGASAIGGATALTYNASVSGSYTAESGITGCSSTSNPIVVAANPDNIITLTSNAGTNAQTVCLNTPITNITYSTTGATDATFIGLPGGISGSWVANVVTISGTPNTATGSPFNYTVTLTGGCGIVTASGTITVNPIPDVVQPANQVVCNNSSTAAVNFTGAVPGTVFNWTNNTTSIGLAASGMGDIASFTAINTTNAPIVSTITVTPQTGASGNFAYIANFASNTVSVIDRSTNMVITTIPVGNGPYGVSVTPDGSKVYVTNFFGSSVSVISTAANTVIATIPTPFINPRGIVVTPDGSRVYFVYEGSDGVTVISTSTNTVLTTIAGAEGYEIACSPDGTKVYTSNPSNSKVDVINTATNTVITSIPVANVPNGIVVSPDGSRIYVDLFSGNSVAVIDAVTNTVIANVVVGFNPWGISASPDGSKLYVSNGGSNSVSVINTATNIVSATITGFNSPRGVSFTPDGSFAYVASQGANSVHVINTTTNAIVSTVTVGSSPYSVGNFITGNASCTGPSKTFTITVNPTPVGSASSQTICGGTASNVALSSTVTGTTYTWTAAIQTAPSGGTITGFSNCAATCGTSIAQTLTNTGTTSGVVRYTVTPTANGCAGTPFTVDVTVDVCCPTIPTLTTNPSPAVCAGSNVVLTASGLTTMNPNSYGITFKYFSAATATPYTGGTVIATIPNGSLTGGGTGATTTTSILPVGNNFIYAILSPTPTDVNCRPSATASILVNPVPVVTTAATATICSGTATSIALMASTDPGTTFTWTIGTITGAITGASACASSCGTTIAQTLTNPGSAAGTVQYVVTPVSSLGCTGAPYNITVTVNPTPNAVATPASQTICSAGSISTIVLSGAVSGTTYAWTRNNTGTVTGIAASGSGNISGTLTNTTNAPITVTFTIIPTANSCPGSAITATVLVNPTPNAVATPASQTICSAGSISTIVLSGAVSGTTYAWTRDNAVAVTGIAASGSGNISGSLTNTTNAPVTVTFTIIPTANSCPGAAITATVLVNPTPNAVATPATQTICSAASISTIVLSGAVSGTTYAWTRDNSGTVTGIAASGSGNISGFLTNTTNAPVTVTFTITPTANSCPGAAITATVLVNPTPNALATPASQTICSAASISTIVLSGAVSGTTYAWTRDNAVAVTGIAASGSGNISGSLTNTTNAPVTVTFTIIPTANSCPGAAITATVLVNPTPNAVATPATQTICSAASISTIVLSGAVSGTTYAWTRDNAVAVTGIAASGSGNISGSLTNTTNAPVTVTFTIIPTANSCPGAAITATVLVNPTPNAVATPASQTICSASSISTIVLTGAVSGTTYAWTRNNTGTVTGIAASGSGNISGTLTNTTNAPVTVTFTIIPTANSCPGAAITATVLVNPTPNAVATPATQTICSATSISTIVLTGAVSGTTYAWTRNNTGTVTGIAASGSGNISGSLTNTTSAPITVTFTITPTANGCPGAAITATVLVNPTPTAVATPATQTICSETLITTITLSGPVSGTTFTWTRNNTATVTGIAASGSGNNIFGALTNTTSAPITVTFTITPSANGCIGTTTTATVIVNPKPIGTISIAPNPACVGSTVQLSASGGNTYSWSGPLGWTSSVQNPTILLTTHLQAGKYFVTVSNTYGCSVVLSSQLSVNYPPIATASYEQNTACTGSTLLLHGTGAGSYAWSGPNGFTSNQQNPQIPNVTGANSGLYILVVTSPNGCTATTTLNITINNPPALSANPTLTQTCEGSKIQLFASGTGSFVWNGPATYTSTDQNPVIQNIPIHMSGIYTVNLTASTGCVSAASVTVKVYDQIHAIATASEDTICQGQSLQLHAEGGSTYLWNGPNGFNSTESDPRIDNITPAASGKYYVYISNEGGCFGYAELTIVVKPSAKSFAYATPSPVNENSPVQFIASSNGVAYSWSGPLGFTSNQQNPFIKKVSRYMAGVYTVTITNENGCPSIVKVILRVLYTNKGGNTIDGDDDGLTTRSEVTGTVYPNPTNDLLYFDTQSNEAIEYVIYDVNGKMQVVQKTTSDKFISTSQLPSGVYQIRWKSKDSEQWIVSKFVKIR